jgi:fructoselysine-6-P-deglycase FrlB-like protein
MTGAVCAATSWLLTDAAAAWQKLSRAHDPSLPGCRSSVGEGPEIILGHGAGEWVAREGALKFVEMTRTRVEAFETEEFFHGWAFARQERRLWHVVEGDDPRQGKAASARRFPIPTGDPFAWVEPLVELQWLALALALNLARNPDDPRAVAA